MAYESKTIKDTNPWDDDFDLCLSKRAFRLVLSKIKLENVSKIDIENEKI